jgi:hypothetical protein
MTSRRKQRARALDRGELQLLLRPEMAKEPALAHRELGRETPDAQTLETLDRSQLHSDLRTSLIGG